MNQNSNTNNNGSSRILNEDKNLDPTDLDLKNLNNGASVGKVS
jgi:hypothetical protein